MVTMAQRIEALRTLKNISRPALAAAMGLPKTAIEKFETGRQSPTKEQAQRLADYFGVSIFYLRGESSDPTRQDDWMTGALNDVGQDHVPIQQPKKKAVSEPVMAGQSQGTIFDSFLKSKAFQDMVRDTVREVLRSEEGRALIARAVKTELGK